MSDDTWGTMYFQSKLSGPRAHPQRVTSVTMLRHVGKTNIRLYPQSDIDAVNKEVAESYELLEVLRRKRRKAKRSIREETVLSQMLKSDLIDLAESLGIEPEGTLKSDYAACLVGNIDGILEEVEQKEAKRVKRS